MLLTKELLHTTATHIKKLNQSGFKTIEDLINHYPRTYENKSNVLDSFSFVNIKEKNAIKVTLETIKEERTRNGKMLIKAIIRDANNFFAEAVWFNQTYLMRQFRIGDTVLLFGKPKYEYGKLSFV